MSLTKVLGLDPGLNGAEALRLKVYAKQIDDAVKDGVVNLIAEIAYQEVKS